jgi:hypothetical protein
LVWIRVLDGYVVPTALHYLCHERNHHAGAIDIESLIAELRPSLAASSKIPKYISLAACSAFIEHVEHLQFIFSEPGSMRIRLELNDKAPLLDISTKEGTEPIRSAKETSPSQKRNGLLSVVARHEQGPANDSKGETL